MHRNYTDIYGIGMGLHMNLSRHKNPAGVDIRD